MFPKEERLTREEFEQAFKHGVRVHTPATLFIYAAAGTRGAAVVVSKKVAKSAVLRNRLRRQVYTALRTVGPVSGTSIVLLKSFPKGSFLDLLEELGTAANRAVGISTRSR
jgi:ribonuclease P protein component